jgi:5,5'-dehydrodivanillate O-demethylase
MEKGIVYSKALGAKADRKSRHSTVIFPFYTQINSAGAPRSDLQMRVPIDDTHTLHITYGCYAGPPGVAAPKQNLIPWYEPPLFDEQGKPILDYVLAQDALCWWGQGDRVDRSQETLGRTDLPIVFMRRQLEEQIALVEQGKEPMNVFRDEHDILFAGGSPAEGWVEKDWAKRQLVKAEREQYRALYHKGYVGDDADRYGPAVPQIIELHRAIEEAQIAARESADHGE